ncbi:hypothetical protein JBL43_18165 [Aureibaculum sp. A20]|uniref:DUF4293 family protein n=1 Tax=Aureibaculum flavum TaxID=2795986 RepID=A0ABS0WW51_9FLAO|nr:hypothetical protein [Aureibaculum flavum]MBJ2176182.1 hypothetical protein [Aureibaculum flavum]
MKKVAAILALFIGLMSIFAGSKVLIGIDTKPYTILIWLVIYNIVLGVISVLTSLLIWRQRPSAKTMIIYILLIHTLMLLFLYFIIDTVSSESIKAMIFRVSVWTLIFILTTYPSNRKKLNANKPDPNEH